MCKIIIESVVAYMIFMEINVKFYIHKLHIKSSVFYFIFDFTFLGNESGQTFQSTKNSTHQPSRYKKKSNKKHFPL